MAVVCTSGTAVANLHPAMVEAAHSHLPLIALTADRPIELVGSGASQTTAQHGIFGALVSTVDFPMAELRPGQNAVWRGMVCRSLRSDGPVHLNVPFREPLVPDGSDDWPEPLDGRADGRPWTSVAAAVETRSGATEIGHLGERTLVVIGDVAPEIARATATFAAAAGWPVIVEPLAFAAGDTIGTGSLLLSAGLPPALRPESLLVVGHPSLSRGVQRVIRETPVVHVISDHPQWTDPQHQADYVTGPLAVDPPRFGDAWLSRWRDADVSAKSVVDSSWPTSRGPPACMSPRRWSTLCPMAQRFSSVRPTPSATSTWPPRTVRTCACSPTAGWPASTAPCPAPSAWPSAPGTATPSSATSLFSTTSTVCSSARRDPAQPGRRRAQR